jgi:hypothetical protein
MRQVPVHQPPVRPLQTTSVDVVIQNGQMLARPATDYSDAVRGAPGADRLLVALARLCVACGVRWDASRSVSESTVTTHVAAEGAW